ncbi:MAG TPA: PTS mannose/fructose/sorbose transporter subunit IIB [Anaerolineaceae bacterium]|nr:PTS mannose/fructose/sorbose transporter subunit IIB [Anaerolineaceae bacterium]
MITLIRVDDRLIHGQCIVRVLADFKIEKIVIVDDFTASNPVLKNVFLLATPPQAKSVIFSVEETKPNLLQFIENNENVLLLMRSPTVALELFKSHPQLKMELNIGPISYRPDTIKVTSYTYLSTEEIEAVNEIAERRVRVYFNQTIDQKIIEWNEVKNLLRSG